MIAVIFTSQIKSLNKNDLNLYDYFNDELEKIAKQITGFIKQTSCRNESGFGISISYWTDYESALIFRKNTLHKEAQEKGRELFYTWYDVKIAEISKEYSFNLPQ